MARRFRRWSGDRAYTAAVAALLIAAIGAAGYLSRASDWHPFGLVVLLAILAIIGQVLSVRIGALRLTASFIALVLAMVLLGPAPATAMGVLVMLIDTPRMPRRPMIWISNFATYATFPLVGGLLARAALGSGVHAGAYAGVRGVVLGLAVFGIFTATNLLNFLLTAVGIRVVSGRGIVVQIRTMLWPMLPSEAAAGVLAAVFAAAYAGLHNGLPLLTGLVVVLVVFMGLVRALLRSEERAEQLAARSSQLAYLQVGVLITLMETLAWRDPMTARHGAAVARLARALAREAGLGERDQDLAHTAGLLHDIAMFALPDRILRATELSDEDWALVKRHAQDGATLVGRLDGYGPVAEIILYHHERIDGAGYPAGLIGKEIPLLARVVAVCETYDVLTARDSYRTPVTPVEAIAELRRVAGRQLDADLVDRFIVMIERDGAAGLANGDDADFEAELALERRARAIAAPSV